jgi:chromosome segregation protein
MPLRLKSLELHGYKTFATKTRFEFSDGVTAIVGPNGSGKSNIADAIRWVLGEQSFSLLRGKKTEDMIFSGSENRPRAGMASASIIFDNSDNWLSIEFSEVELARRAYRDGRNDYLLNSQHVRLREINELLAQSGLSERTYTILGQGLVDASLALKADERRRLFEEAAGIGIYRSRREEALKRLEATRRNLDRVLDILAELEPRLRSLEKQAKRSQEFLQMQADLRISLREWYGYHWNRTQKEMNSARDLMIINGVKLQEIRETHQGIRQEFLIFRDKLQSIRSQLNSWHRESAKLHSSRETISRDMAVLEERKRAIQENCQNMIVELNRLEDEMEFARERFNESEREAGRLEQESEEARSFLRSAQETLQVQQTKRNHVEGLLESIKNENTTMVNQQFKLQTQQEESKSRLEIKRPVLDEISATISKTEKEINRADEIQRKIKIVREETEESLKVTGKQLSDVKLKLQEMEDRRKSRIDERMEFLTETARLKVQLEVLEQAEQSLTGFSDGARLILDAARLSDKNPHVRSLSSVLDVPSQLEPAITAVLAEFADSIIIGSEDDLANVVLLLQKSQAGHATLLPIEKLSIPVEMIMPQKSTCLGIARDMVRIDPEFQVVADFLLGRVLIVPDWKEARKLIKGVEKDIKIVTLAGEVLFANGPMKAGKQGSSGVLGRTHHKREIQELLSQNEHQIELVSSVILEADTRIASIQNEFELVEKNHKQTLLKLESKIDDERKAQQEYGRLIQTRDWQLSQRSDLMDEIDTVTANIEILTEEMTRINQDIGNIQEKYLFQSSLLSEVNYQELAEQVTYWNTQLAVSERALSDFQNRRNERIEVRDQLESQIEIIKTRLHDYENTLTLLDGEKTSLREREIILNDQLEALRILIEPAEAELENAEFQEGEIQKQEITNQEKLVSADRYYNQVQLDFGRKQEAVENLRQKIEDDFGLVSLEYATNVEGPVPLPWDGMVEQLVSVEVPSLDLEETISRQRLLIRRMGPINPEAQLEFESVTERHKFLETQLDDLQKAEVDLRQVISELDEITRQEFLKTFTEVADEFVSIFHRLFGGGSAKLILTDPDNLTETGIDIEARLPGRREQGLALLSGGERSLTAIALVFSLLKVSPTPVCVLDEVDAMLDEANVRRFRELVQELSKDTQFIIITHNRNTIQAADVIYGVTMGRDSVSQIISLKLEEVNDEILKG